MFPLPFIFMWYYAAKEKSNRRLLSYSPFDKLSIRRAKHRKIVRERQKKREKRIFKYGLIW